VLFGEAAEKIKKAIIRTLHSAEPVEESVTRPYTLDHVEHLEDAIHKAAEAAEPGDIVLLSPGGTSFDEFKDFEERGEKFRLWVQKLL